MATRYVLVVLQSQAAAGRKDLLQGYFVHLGHSSLSQKKLCSPTTEPNSFLYNFVILKAFESIVTGYMLFCFFMFYS